MGIMELYQELLLCEIYVKTVEWKNWELELHTLPRRMYQGFMTCIIYLQMNVLRQAIIQIPNSMLELLNQAQA